MSNQIQTVNPVDESPISSYELMDRTQAFEAVEASP